MDWQKNIIPPGPPWNPGDRVRVVSGPFVDFIGKVRDVSEERKKLCIIISVFGRETPVEVDFTQVEEANKHG